MIQRIQTLYLLIAVVLLGLMATLPIAQYFSDITETVYKLGFNGIRTEDGVVAGFSVLPFSILTGLCLLVALVTIFLFKKRMFQIRLTIFNIILLLGLQGLTLYYIIAAKTELDATYSFMLPFVFPIVAAILSFLAFRAISKDEAIIRSLERLR